MGAAGREQPAPGSADGEHGGTDHDRAHDVQRHRHGAAVRGRGDARRAHLGRGGGAAARADPRGLRGRHLGGLVQRRELPVPRPGPRAALVRGLRRRSSVRQLAELRARQGPVQRRVHLRARRPARGGPALRLRHVPREPRPARAGRVRRRERRDPLVGPLRHDHPDRSDGPRPRVVHDAGPHAPGARRGHRVRGRRPRRGRRDPADRGGGRGVREGPRGPDPGARVREAARAVPLVLPAHLPALPRRRGRPAHALAPVQRDPRAPVRDGAAGAPCSWTAPSAWTAGSP